MARALEELFKELQEGQSWQWPLNQLCNLPLLKEERFQLLERKAAACMNECVEGNEGPVFLHQPGSVPPSPHFDSLSKKLTVV